MSDRETERKRLFQTCMAVVLKQDEARKRAPARRIHSDSDTSSISSESPERKPVPHYAAPPIKSPPEQGKSISKNSSTIPVTKSNTEKDARKTAKDVPKISPGKHIRKTGAVKKFVPKIVKNSPPPVKPVTKARPVKHVLKSSPLKTVPEARSEKFVPGSKPVKPLITTTANIGLPASRNLDLSTTSGESCSTPSFSLSDTTSSSDDSQESPNQEQVKSKLTKDVKDKTASTSKTCTDNSQPTSMLDTEEVSTFSGMESNKITSSVTAGKGKTNSKSSLNTPSKGTSSCETVEVSTFSHTTVTTSSNTSDSSTSGSGSSTSSSITLDKGRSPDPVRNNPVKETKAVLSIPVTLPNQVNDEVREKAKSPVKKIDSTKTLSDFSSIDSDAKSSSQSSKSSMKQDVAETRPASDLKEAGEKEQITPKAGDAKYSEDSFLSELSDITSTHSKVKNNANLKQVNKKTRAKSGKSSSDLTLPNKTRAEPKDHSNAQGDLNKKDTEMEELSCETKKSADGTHISESTSGSGSTSHQETMKFLESLDSEIQSLQDSIKTDTGAFTPHMVSHGYDFVYQEKSSEKEDDTKKPEVDLKLCKTECNEGGNDGEAKEKEDLYMNNTGLGDAGTRRNESAVRVTHAADLVSRTTPKTELKSNSNSCDKEKIKERTNSTLLQQLPKGGTIASSSPRICANICDKLKSELKLIDTSISTDERSIEGPTETLSPATVRLQTIIEKYRANVKPKKTSKLVTNKITEGVLQADCKPIEPAHPGVSRTDSNEMKTELAHAQNNTDIVAEEGTTNNGATNNNMNEMKTSPDAAQNSKSISSSESKSPKETMEFLKSLNSELESLQETMKPDRNSVLQDDVANGNTASKSSEPTSSSGDKSHKETMKFLKSLNSEIESLQESIISDAGNLVYNTNPGNDVPWRQEESLGKKSALKRTETMKSAQGQFVCMQSRQEQLYDGKVDAFLFSKSDPPKGKPFRPTFKSHMQTSLSGKNVNANIGESSRIETATSKRLVSSELNIHASGIGEVESCRRKPGIGINKTCQVTFKPIQLCQEELSRKSSKYTQSLKASKQTSTTHLGSSATPSLDVIIGEIPVKSSWWLPETRVSETKSSGSVIPQIMESLSRVENLLKSRAAKLKKDGADGFSSSPPDTEKFSSSRYFDRSQDVTDSLKRDGNPYASQKPGSYSNLDKFTTSNLIQVEYLNQILSSTIRVHEAAILAAHEMIAYQQRTRDKIKRKQKEKSNKNVEHEPHPSSSEREQRDEQIRRLERARLRYEWERLERDRDRLERERVSLKRREQMDEDAKKRRYRERERVARQILRYDSNRFKSDEKELKKRAAKLDRNKTKISESSTTLSSSHGPENAFTKTAK